MLLGPLLQLIERHSRTSAPFYSLEPAIAALSVFFCRLVIITGSLTSSPSGHTSLVGPNRLEFAGRFAVAALMGVMTYCNVNYDIVCAVHLCSHVMPAAMRWYTAAVGRRGGTNEGKQQKKNKKGGGKRSGEGKEGVEPSLALSMGLAAIFLTTPPLCLYACRLLSDPSFLNRVAADFVPLPLSRAFRYMFPIEELAASYGIVTSFVADRELLRDMICHLLFVTFHIQFGMGHIGIAFLTAEQRRKNMLIRMDVDEEAHGGARNGGASPKGDAEERKRKKHDRSRRFRRSAPSFIFLTVLPYMFQIILFGE